MAIALEVRGLTRMIELPPYSAAAIAKREAKRKAQREEYERLYANDPNPPAPSILPSLNEDTPRMRCVFSNVSFSLQRGTTLAIVGPAGCGKTQLLRSIAQLDATHGGDVLLHGKLPEEIGYPAWRTRVAYVQQRQVRLTDAHGGRIPRNYFNSIMSLEAHRARRTKFADPMAIARKWGLADHIFETPWDQLSASEHQRMMLAIALACKPDVILLDEPTSMLDEATTHMVETVIRSLGLSVIWVTRDIFQAERVADSVLEFSALTHVDVAGGPDGALSPSSADQWDDLDEFELAAMIHEAVEAQAEAARIAASVESGIQAEAEIQRQEHAEHLQQFTASHGLPIVPESENENESDSQLAHAFDDEKLHHSDGGSH